MITVSHEVDQRARACSCGEVCLPDTPLCFNIWPHYPDGRPLKLWHEPRIGWVVTGPDAVRAETLDATP